MGCTCGLHLLSKLSSLQAKISCLQVKCARQYLHLSISGNTFPYTETLTHCIQMT